jgi:hypothetical protein
MNYLCRANSPGFPHSLSLWFGIRQQLAIKANTGEI